MNNDLQNKNNVFIKRCIQCAAERRSRHRAWPKKQKNTIQKTTKKASTINPKSINNGLNIDQKSAKIEVWRHLGGGLEASWGFLGRLGSNLGCLGRLRAVLMASWEYLEASGRRLGVVLEASWSRLEDVLERLGSSWGVMWASWERLGGILCLIFKPKWVKFRYAILGVILQVILDGFCLQKSMPELWKIIKFYWKNTYCLLSGCFNIILFLDVILLSTWIQFKLQNPPTSLLGGV